MEGRKRTTNQGGQGQGDTSKPGNNSPGKDADREGADRDTSKQDGRPTPSGVPNEGRRAKAQEGYKYKGGRQGTGGIPNPDDPDDRDSAGSFRGTADEETGADDSGHGVGAGQGRKQDLNGQLRNPK